MEPFEEAREIALKYIDYAPRTTTEVRRRLERSQIDPEIIEAVIGELVEIGVLDDAQFSRDWVESRGARKGLGRRRLAVELRRKGVDQELVEEAVEEIAADQELQAALALARQRVRPEDLADPAAKRRTAAFLQRRGYNWDIIEQVFNQILANNG